MPGFVASFCGIIMIAIAHFMGRKFTMAILAINIFICSTLTYFSKTVLHLFVSQIIIGPIFSSLTSVMLLILTEYSSPKYRGIFSTIKAAMLYWGVWVANAIGLFTHYKYIGLVGIFCSIYCLIIIFIIPESPYWLAFRRRYDECAVAHRWLKGTDEDAEKELEILIKTQKENVKNEDSVKSLRKYLVNCFRAIKQPDIYKPLILSFLVTSINKFSGKMVFAVYAVEMMKKSTKNQSSVLNGVLIIDGFTVFAMYVGAGLSKILKRRTLLLSTSITSTVLLFIMSFYLYLIKYSVIPENDNIIIAMLIVYSVAICCGPMILATAISSELLPINNRSFCVFIYSLVTLAMFSTVVKVSPYLFNSIGFCGIDLVFGICSTIIIILVYKYVPETKDRTLQEIADMFKPKGSMDATQSKLLRSRQNGVN